MWDFLKNQVFQAAKNDRTDKHWMQLSKNMPLFPLHKPNLAEPFSKTLNQPLHSLMLHMQVMIKGWPYA